MVERYLFVLVYEGSQIYSTEVFDEFESLKHSYLSYRSVVQKQFESQEHLLVTINFWSTHNSRVPMRDFRIFLIRKIRKGFPEILPF